MGFGVSAAKAGWDTCVNGGGKGGGDEMPKEGDCACVGSEEKVEGLRGVEFMLLKVERVVSVECFGEFGSAVACA